ncbi:MAG: hypothetical protein Q9200_005393 [Gallowayella weberi]
MAGMLEQIEKKLIAALEDQEFSSPKTEILLQEYRVVCQRLTLENFGDSLSLNIEGKLWDAHLRINGRFRKQLAYGIKGKKKSVEQRKAAKSYISFLKTAQRFYRGYIQRLASLPGGIREITAIAQNLSLETDSSVSEADKQTSPEVQHALRKSCHQILIHLGDLSRYRESCLTAKAKKKNWGPAIGYYDLAVAVDPSSGLPYNQLAIIYRTEGDPTRTLYYLYRALSAYEPPPTAFNNLCLEFRRTQEKVCEPGPGLIDDACTNMQRWFPLLHSLYFSGIATREYDGLEDKLLEQLCIGLNERSLDADFLCMVVLSNIAADFAAGDRWQDDPEEEQKEHAFKSFQRLNIRMFSALLQSLKTEHQQAISKSTADKTDGITSSIRRLLPGLRYYSFWLISRATLLSLHQEDMMMDRFVREFWTIYAEALSQLISVTRFEVLPRIEYLLEEDEEIIGFRPLQEGRMTQKCDFSNSSTRKPKCHEVGVGRLNPETEMLCRIRDLLEDASELAQKDDIPLQLIQGKNFFVEKGTGHTSIPVGGEQNCASVPAERKSIMPPEHPPQFEAGSTTDDTTSQEAPASGPLSIALHEKMNDDPAAESRIQYPGSPSLSTTTYYPPAQGNPVNETSYGIGESTLNALHSINRGDEGPRNGQPTLSHIQPLHKASPPSPKISHESITSSSSGRISDPTQQSQGPSQLLPWQHPARTIITASRYTHRHGNRFEEFEFHSSSIVPGSSDFIRASNGNNDVAQATPPNGQG